MYSSRHLNAEGRQRITGCFITLFIGVCVCATGLESVELLMSKEIPGQNRGFCFLEFYNHACAQHAKAALSPPNFQCGIC